MFYKIHFSLSEIIILHFILSAPISTGCGRSRLPPPPPFCFLYPILLFWRKWLPSILWPVHHSLPSFYLYLSSKSEGCSNKDPTPFLYHQFFHFYCISFPSLHKPARKTELYHRFYHLTYQKLCPHPTYATCFYSCKIFWKSHLLSSFLYIPFILLTFLISPPCPPGQWNSHFLYLSYWALKHLSKQLTILFLEKSFLNFCNTVLYWFSDKGFSCSLKV